MPFQFSYQAGKQLIMIILQITTIDIDSAINQL